MDLLYLFAIGALLMALCALVQLCAKIGRPA